MRAIQRLSILLLLLSIAGCGHLRLLEDDLRGEYGPRLGYIHNPQKKNFKIYDTLVVRLSGEYLQDETHITRVNRYPIFMLVFNTFKTKMQVDFGQDHIRTDFKEFFKNSLKEDTERRACFKLSEAFNDSAYVLDITMEPPSLKGYVTKSTYVFIPGPLIISGVGTTAYTSESHLKFKASLKKGQRLLFEKQYHFKQNRPYLWGSRVAGEDAVWLMKNNVAENLSQCTNQAVNDIIRDVNQALETIRAH